MGWGAWLQSSQVKTLKHNQNTAAISSMSTKTSKNLDSGQANCVFLTLFHLLLCVNLENRLLSPSLHHTQVDKNAAGGLRMRRGEPVRRTSGRRCRPAWLHNGNGNGAGEKEEEESGGGQEDQEETWPEGVPEGQTPPPRVSWTGLGSRWAHSLAAFPPHTQHQPPCLLRLFPY